MYKQNSKSNIFVSGLDLSRGSEDEQEKKGQSNNKKNPTSFWVFFFFFSSQLISLKCNTGGEATHWMSVKHFFPAQFDDGYY